MPVEFHAHDGTAARKAKEFHAHDGSAARKAKEVWGHDGTAARQIFSGASITSPLVLADIFYSGIGTSASVWLNLYTDGMARGYRQGNQLAYETSWYAPYDSAIGASYWVRATLQSGLAPSSGPALNTWHQLNATRSWTYSTSGGAYSMRTGTLLIEVASDSGGSNIVSSDSLNFYVERES